VYIRSGIDKLKHLNVLKMNQFCLNCKEAFSSPLLEERNKSLGRNFLYTVLVFGSLCLISYLMSN
jgi:hypothetical protein